MKCKSYYIILSDLLVWVRRANRQTGGGGSAVSRTRWRPLVVMPEREDERQQGAGDHEEEFRAVKAVVFVHDERAVAVGRRLGGPRPRHLGEDVHGRHVEERAGREEHRDAGRVHVRQRLLALLRGGHDSERRLTAVAYETRQVAVIDSRHL